MPVFAAQLREVAAQMPAFAAQLSDIMAAMGLNFLIYCLELPAL
jgi:hypothetical protein